MDRRKLRFVQSNTPQWVVGVCQVCNRQFKSAVRDVFDAGEDVKAQFEAHTCKQEPALPHAPANQRNQSSDPE